MTLLNKITGNFKSPAVDQPYNRQLLLLVFALMSIGLIIVASASMPEGIALSDDPFRFLKRHLLFRHF